MAAKHVDAKQPKKKTVTWGGWNPESVTEQQAGRKNKQWSDGVEDRWGPTTASLHAIKRAT